MFQLLQATPPEQSFAFCVSHVLDSSFRRPHQRCKPKQNVVFVKTHKTGGSTLTNILHRYGDKNNLVFALPRDGEYRLDWPWRIRNDSFKLHEGVRPNILCHHGRYDRATLARIMPRDTVYVTILRHPLSQYESTFNYMGFGKLLGIQDKTNPLEHFLEMPEKILVSYLLSEDLRVYSDRLKLIRNGMAFDLGLNATDFDNSLQIQDFLRKLKSEFDLVLLAEFFDESLVLLKDLLCWSLEDMTYFKQNVRTHAKNVTFSSAKTINKMQNWNNVDFLLYRQFRNVLKEKITQKTRQKDRARFQHTLNGLRAANKRMRKLCLRNITKTIKLQYDVEVEKMELNWGLDPSTRAACDEMRRNEVDYIKYLRNKGLSFVRTLFLDRPRHAAAHLLRLIMEF